MSATSKSVRTLRIDFIRPDTGEKFARINVAIRPDGAGIQEEKPDLIQITRYQAAQLLRRWRANGSPDRRGPWWDLPQRRNQRIAAALAEVLDGEIHRRGKEVAA